MRPGLLVLIAVMTCVVAPAKAQAPVTSRCLEGLVPALSAGGFSGSTDCDHDQLKLRLIGHVELAGHRFAFYDYRYWLSPPCPECARGWGQRIIVMRDGRYLGQYKPEAVRAAVEGNALILTPTGKLGPEYRSRVVASLTSEGPPLKLWVGGETLEFFK